MAISNIVPENIDGGFPVAGIDNDSQGFRNNFINSAKNFTYAKEEIEDLQKKALLKAPLTGESGVDNDYADALVRAAKTVDFSEVIKNHELIAGPVTLSHVEAHYHIIESTNDVVLIFQDWPDEALGRMRVQIDITDTEHTLELPEEVKIGTNTLTGYDPETFKISFTASSGVAPGIHILEFTSYDAGVNVAVEDITRSPNDIMVRQIITSKGSIGDTQGTICADGLYIYFCYNDFTDGVDDIWGRTQINITPWT